MRGRRERQASTLLGVSTEALIPADHPIRRIRELIELVLDRLSPQLAAMHSTIGR